MAEERYHKVREIVKKKTSVVYGITIPKHIAEDFLGLDMKIVRSGSCIVLESI